MKKIYPIMKDGKNLQNDVMSPSLINYSIRNKKIAESLSPSVNMMNRTTSESLLNKKDSTNIKPYKKIKKKYYIKKNMNYTNSAVELNSKKTYNNFSQKYSKDKNNSKETNNNVYKNSSVENIKVSKKIFNELDKIHETLLEDFKKIIKIETNENKSQENININNNEEIKIEDNQKIKAVNMINYFPKNKNNKYYTVPIKSKTSINFYPINQSHNINSEPPNINTSSHRRLKSTKEKKPHQITRYLERQKINDLPVTFPLFLSYNNKYKSISERNRVDKILNKLICLKTHLIKDPLNRIEIIKEFFLKNGFKKDIFFDEEKIINFYNYLKQPFSFPPEYTLSKVVNEGIHFKFEKDQEENIDVNTDNFLDYVPKNRKWKDYDYYNKKTSKNNSMNGNEIIYNLLMEEIFKKRYMNYESFKNKTLPLLIKDLEYELRQIKIDKMNKLDKYNNLLNSRKLQTIKLLDKNKYVPNLCLISKGFKEKCKATVDKKNKKILKTMNKQEHLRQINNRLYYDNIRKNNLIEFDRNDIQRKLKLTEFVVMQRAKKKLFIQKIKNKYMNTITNNKKE